MTPRVPSRPQRGAALVLALASTSVVLAAPPASAGTTTVPVTHGCVGSFYNVFAQKVDTLPGVGSPAVDAVGVTQPTAVAPGEVFSVTVTPGEMRTGGVPAGRLSYDLTLPADATLLSATPADAGSAVSGTARVDRVDAGAAPNETGGYLRVWGGGKAVGPGEWTTGVNAWRDGLTVPANTTFRLPAVTLTMRAAVTAAGRRISAGYVGAGVSPKTSDPLSALRGMEMAGVVGGEANDVFYCAASANAASLVSTPVDGTRPTHLAVTTTSMVTGDATVLTGSGPTTLTAAVSSTEESLAHLRAGTVRFVVTDPATGATVGTVSGVAVGPDGRASTQYSFPALAAGETRHPYRVRAEYSGTTGDIARSTSGESTITVAYREHVADPVVTSVNGDLANGAMPVTVSGTLRFTDGAAVPSGARVELLRDGVVVGSPVTVGAGGAFTFPADRAPQRATTTAYRYSVRMVPQIVGVDRYSGESSSPVAAIVPGTNADSTVPGGGFGVPGSADLVADPGGFWRLVGASIGSLGTFSVDLGGAAQG